ncbi:MAG: transposase family protein [Actinomycetota bacterium]|nr:transposase family protein [Actinomycetota bacterium]
MNKSNSAVFTIYNSNEIIEALVGLKDVRVISYNRVEKEVFLLVEQIVINPRCPNCGDRAKIHDRVVVSYIDLPVFATPMKLHL